MLGQTNAESKIVIYVAGHAYKNDDGTMFLAPKNFDLKRIATTGLSLQWLLEQFEPCPAKEKLLLLDCTYTGEGGDLRNEPSTAEMVQSLKPTQPGFPALRTVTAVASCQAGQRGSLDAAKQHSLFADALAAAYDGKADKNRDGRLEPTELFDYLTAAMAESSKALNVAQTPQLFLPDARPPRLSDEAKKAIRKLATYLHQEKVDLKKAQGDYEDAAKAAGKEVEPGVLYALILLKLKQAKPREEALQQMQEIAADRPDMLVPSQGMAWAQFEKFAFQAGTDELASLVGRIKPLKKPDESYSPAVQHALFWAGQLREFAATIADPRHAPKAETLQAVDEAVSQHGAQAIHAYEEGRAKTAALAADFDRRAAAAADKADELTVKTQKRQLAAYVNFPFDEAAQAVLAGLDQ